MCARVSQVRACEPVPPERKKKKDNKLLAPPPFPFPYPRHRDPDPEPIGKTKRLKRREIQRRGRKTSSDLSRGDLGRGCAMTMTVYLLLYLLIGGLCVCPAPVASVCEKQRPPPFPVAPRTQYPYVLRAAVRGRRPPLPGPMSMLCSSRLSAMSSFCMRSSSGTLAGMGGAP
jgi:hypothetical protein